MQHEFMPAGRPAKSACRFARQTNWKVETRHPRTLAFQPALKPLPVGVFLYPVECEGMIAHSSGRDRDRFLPARTAGKIHTGNGPFEAGTHGESLRTAAASRGAS